MIEASCVKRSITPRFPMFMRGYAMRTGKSTGVLDELYCRMLALWIDGEVFLWATLDICMPEKALSDYIKTVIAAKYTIPREHILISSIHTHSGPDISFTDEGEERNRRKAEYRSWLEQQILEAADHCLEKGFVAVKASRITGQIEGIYGNRNYRDRPGDKEIQLILFRSGNHVEAGIFQMACHPTVLGIHNMELSSDLMGNVGKALDERFDTTFLTVQGACGDMGNRQYRQGNDQRELWRVKNSLMEQINRITGETGAEQPLDLKVVQVKTTDYKIRYSYDTELLKQQMAEEQKKLDAAVTEDQRKLLWSGIRHMGEKLAAGGVDQTLTSGIFHLGDLDILSVPGELFSAFGLQIKEHMKAPVKMIWGYEHYSAGYIVEAGEYGKGYESMSTLFPQGEAERYVQHLINSL